MRKILVSLAVAAMIAAPAIAQAADQVVTGAAGGAVAGAVVGGPVGAVVGGAIGAVVGTAIEPPPPQVIAYVQEQPPPPAVMLQGSLSVGAQLPPSVTLYPVPPDVYVPGDRRAYGYAEINGQMVIVDPHNYVVIGIVG
jgi:hypothetical protein